MVIKLNGVFNDSFFTGAVSANGVLNGYYAGFPADEILEDLMDFNTVEKFTVEFLRTEDVAKESEKYWSS